MKLFSWFMKRNDITSSQLVRAPFKQEKQKPIECSMDSNMWPIAQARHNTHAKQQQYVSTRENLSSKSTTTTKEKKA